MTDILRDKLINKGWVTPFNAGTLVRLIDEHYAELTKPVPVSERLPGPEDCDAEGRCWLRGKVEGDWRLLNPNNSGVPQLKYCFTHWLPAHALPIPHQQENAND